MTAGERSGAGREQRPRARPRDRVRAVQPARHARGRRRPDHRRVGRGEDDALSQLRLQGRPHPRLPRARARSAGRAAGCRPRSSAAPTTPRAAAAGDLRRLRRVVRARRLRGLLVHQRDARARRPRAARCGARACASSRRSAASSPAWREEAGIEDTDGFARQWHILMKGCIVAAAEGDRAGRGAGARARHAAAARRTTAIAPVDPPTPYGPARGVDAWVTVRD